MRRALPFIVPFCVVLLLGLGLTGLPWSSQPTGDPVEIDFQMLHDGEVHVRLEGMAHYASTVNQRVAGGIMTGEKQYYLFGFFPKHATDAGAIPLLVRTTRKPERLVTYEVMTVEGVLGAPTANLVPPSTEAMLSKRTDYWFADEVMLLEATRITSEDGVYKE